MAITRRAPSPRRLPHRTEISRAASDLLLIASAYGIEGDLGALATHASRRAADKAASLLKTTVKSIDRLYEHVRLLHRDTYLAGLLTDALERNEDIGERFQHYTGRELTPGQRSAIEKARERDARARAPRDSAAVRAVAKLLGMTERAVYKARARGRIDKFQFSGMWPWVGHEEPLKSDDAQRALLRFVIVHVLERAEADYHRTIETLGFTSEDDE
jgi:hypothetical protein